ncbi:MAG: VOC family protein [Solirubrobacteraceae bacterium]|nr:VOC family protein [Solirubrobacteraceae bacterium]
MQLRTHVMFQSGVAAEAGAFYASVVPGGEVVPTSGFGGSVLVRLAGHEVVLFDSPMPHDFGLTPSTSLFLEVDEAGQVDDVVGRLLEGGHALMPVGEYDFAARFGWCVDRFGVSWQVVFRGSE